jgi:hypothetical protein
MRICISPFGSDLTSRSVTRHPFLTLDGCSRFLVPFVNEEALLRHAISIIRRTTECVAIKKAASRRWF